MRYFVTGATGFVGGRVARLLVQDGHEVIALVRQPNQATDLERAGMHIVAGDIVQRESMRAAMRGVDGVFHLAAWYKVGARDGRLAEEVNVVGTRNVLELMQQLGIRRGVYTSTLAVNSDTHGAEIDETYQYRETHLTHYDRTKWRAHFEVAMPLIRQGLPLMIVMPGMVYGPGDAGPAHDFLLQYLRRKLFVAPRGTAFCWGHVADIARGHLQAMERGRLGETYMLAGPAHTLLEVLDVLQSLTGIAPPRLRPVPGVVRALAGVAALVERFAALPTTYSAEALRCTAGVTYLGDSTKARRELGFAARALREGMSETIASLGAAPRRAAGNAAAGNTAAHYAKAERKSQG